MPSLKICPACGIQFRPSNSKAKTCSPQCGWTMRGRKHFKKKCRRCGTTFKPKRTGNDYCSKRCWYLDTDNHESLNTKSQEVDYAFMDLKAYRATNRWKDLRDIILERDNYTCQYCLKTASNLGQNPSVHHIIPLREFWPDRVLDSEAYSNLISLCISCHRRVESGNLECPTPKDSD